MKCKFPVFSSVAVSMEFLLGLFVYIFILLFYVVCYFYLAHVRGDFVVV